ncbi:MAG: hypothetical protein JWO89_3412, partial [Verrucomicrobiaceae bacterium]|nr:hypothetical protein [Verrucomicrobiaceae bacterium]
MLWAVMRLKPGHQRRGSKWGYIIIKRLQAAATFIAMAEAVLNLSLPPAEAADLKSHRTTPSFLARSPASRAAMLMRQSEPST